LTRALKTSRKRILEKQSNADVGKEEEEEEEEEVIKELENHGDLKKDVPVGGEEFENEEPRQGD
jgi:hypothetical protein